MKKSIIEEICFHNERLIERVVLSEKYKNLSHNAHEFYTQLNAVLNDEQKKIFNDFTDSEMGVCAEGESLFFKEGLKAGLLLAIECLI